MKVWILYTKDFDDTDVIKGIYSNEEICKKAEKELDKNKIYCWICDCDVIE